MRSINVIELIVPVNITENVSPSVLLSTVTVAGPFIVVQLATLLAPLCTILNVVIVKGGRVVVEVVVLVVVCVVVDVVVVDVEDVELVLVVVCVVVELVDVVVVVVVLVVVVVVVVVVVAPPTVTAVESV